MKCCYVPSKHSRLLHFSLLVNKFEVMPIHQLKIHTSTAKCVIVKESIKQQNESSKPLLFIFLHCYVLNITLMHEIFHNSWKELWWEFALKTNKVMVTIPYSTISRDLRCVLLTLNGTFPSLRWSNFHMLLFAE